MNNTSSALVSVATIVFLILMLFLMFWMIKKIIQSNRRYREKQKKERDVKAQREHEIAVAKEERAKAEAEARIREMELKDERNRKNALERSTVTIGGKTKTVAEIVSDHVSQEMLAINSSGNTAASIERLNMAQVKCIQCGGAIDSGSRFCKFCGTQVPENIFRAEVNIHDEARIKEIEYRHNREKKLLHRFAEAQQAAAKNIEATTDKIRAKSEARKIELEEKARLQRVEQEEKEREQKERMARVRSAQIKEGVLLLIIVLLAIIFMVIYASSHR